MAKPFSWLNLKTAGATLAVCTTLLAASCSKATSHESSPQNPFATITIPAAAGTFELSRGEYLVAVLNSTCEDCRGTVNTLNGLMMAERLPMLVGLVMGDTSALEEFRKETTPAFPITPVTPELFFQLIGENPPRLLHIKDGVTLALWDGQKAIETLLERGTLADSKPAGTGEANAT